MMHRNSCPTDSGAVPCPVCGAPMIRVTSHDQCPQCGFILPCCDGDAVINVPATPVSDTPSSPAENHDRDVSPER